MSAMTQILGESVPAAQVLSGTVVGRFIYTSEGSAGWRISSSVGSPPAEVQQDAVKYNQRLTSPGGYAVPQPQKRNRRMAWVGPQRSQWRFLMNSIAAGMDASGRANNCVNDCLVVRRDQMAAGADPASFWSSPDWSTPYGANEVSALDLRANGSALNPQVPSAVDVAELVAFLLHERRAPGYLLGLAGLIDFIEQRVGVCWVGTADEVQAGGPILLSSLYRLLPCDIGWDLTSEIWYLTEGQATHSGSEAVLRVADADRLPSDVEAREVSDATTWTPGRITACPDCGQRQWSWADVLTTALYRLATLMRQGAPDEEITHLAQVFSAYCQALRDQGVSSEACVSRFTRDAMPEQYRDLTMLIGDVMTHDHIKVLTYNSDPIAGTEGLRGEPPSDLTHLLAKWFLNPLDEPPTGLSAVPGGASLFGGPPAAPTGISRSRADQLLLGVHLALGDSPEQAFRWLQNFEYLSPNERALIMSSGPAMYSAVCNRILRSVAVVATAHYKSPYPLKLKADVIEACFTPAAGEDWWEPIAHLDLLNHFLQAWTDGIEPSAVSRVLREPVTREGIAYPLGCWMAMEALKPRDAELAGQYLGIIEQQLYPGAGMEQVLQELRRHVRRTALGHVLEDPHA